MVLIRRVDEYLDESVGFLLKRSWIHNPTTSFNSRLLIQMDFPPSSSNPPWLIFDLE